MSIVFYSVSFSLLMIFLSPALYQGYKICSNCHLPKLVSFIYFNKNPLKMINIFLSSEKLFSFLRFHFCLDFFGYIKNALMRKLRYISKFMTSQTWTQTITIKALSDISISKWNWSIFEVFEYKRNKRGADIDPWGTPHSTYSKVVWLWRLFQYMVSCLTDGFLSSCGCYSCTIWFEFFKQYHMMWSFKGFLKGQ